MTDSSGFSMESITGSPSTITVLVGAVLALLGSFMTWVTIEGIVSAGGMDEGGDGVITLVVAVATAAAAIFLKGNARKYGVIAGGVVLVLVAVLNIADIFSTADDFGVSASVGIGLWMVLVGGVAAGAAAFMKR